MSYSPQLRTAVLLSGSGTAGAYHAGVLHALHEAGTKLDVISGRGIGVAGAMFAAIDAAPMTWEEGGLWRRTPAARLYRWRRSLQVATALLLAAAAFLALPLLVLAAGLIAYPLSFLLEMVSVEAGQRVAAVYLGLIARVFAPTMLPALVPKLVTLAVAAAVAILAATALRPAARGRKELGHRTRGHWWTRTIGSPWSITPGLQHYKDSLWHLLRGPASETPPTLPELSRRYLELLTENLGQPGFRELIVTALDLETRTDLIFAVLDEQHRQVFFHRGRGDFVDLAGVGRGQMLDVLAGALSLPMLTEPHLLAFSPESYWKGETHRMCDRPAAVGRLLDELSTAGVEQVIVVSASADRSAPHRLTRPSGSLEARLSEHLSAAEASSVRDAIATHAAMFQGVFLIQPEHNAVGPFDFNGAYDDRSDRFQTIAELIDRGYADAYRQFIEPVVGAV